MIPDPISNIINRLEKIEALLGIECPKESIPTIDIAPAIEKNQIKEEVDRLFLFKLRSAYRQVSNTSKIKDINYENPG